MVPLNLVVVAHPDDEILGFAGTGAKLVASGEIVQPVFLCGKVDARTQRPVDGDLEQDIANANKTVGFDNPVLGSFPNIRMNTVDHIEIVSFIEKQIRTFKPKRIFTHHPSDLNNDHLQVSKACLVASRLFQRTDEIPPLDSLHYMEILSSTDWSYQDDANVFRPNLYVEIKDELELKLKALECYRNVMRPFPHPRSVEVIKGLAAYRGAQSGQYYAEAFQTVFKRGIF